MYYTIIYLDHHETSKNIVVHAKELKNTYTKLRDLGKTILKVYELQGRKRTLMSYGYSTKTLDYIIK